MGTVDNSHCHWLMSDGLTKTHQHRSDEGELGFMSYRLTMSHQVSYSIMAVVGGSAGTLLGAVLCCLKLKIACRTILVRHDIKSIPSWDSQLFQPTHTLSWCKLYITIRYNNSMIHSLRGRDKYSLEVVVWDERHRRCFLWLNKDVLCPGVIRISLHALYSTCTIS